MASDKPRRVKLDVSASIYLAHSLERPVSTWASSRMTSMDLFLSVASLQGVQSLRVCRVGERCTGLQILHDNGEIELLGQWFPEHASSTSLIYDLKDGPLATVIFLYSRAGRKSQDSRYVYKIIAELGSSSPLPIESDSYHASIDTVRQIR